MLASYRISHSVVAQRSLGGAKQTKQKAEARPNARHHLLSLLLVRIITPTVPTVRFNTITTSLHALTWMQTNAKKWHYTAIEKSERH
jgi:hypothetical protein